MKGKAKRNLSEFAINLYTARWLLFSASQLTSGGTMQTDEKEASDNCHIYIISKIPSFSFEQESFQYKDGIISGNLMYQIKGKIRKIPFEQEFPLLDDAVSLELSDYPYRQINTLNEKGEIVRYLQASFIAMAIGAHINNLELSDLEVLYVGQSIGTGSRTAFDRLKSHSTLQKILADTQYHYPEYEAYLLTFEYLPYRVITIGGPMDSDINEEADKSRFFSILDNPLTEQQQVSLAEAALIRYFQPRYNEIYKDNFPSNKHKILEQCYKLDFSALIVEINTEELRYRLYSEKVKPDYHHSAKFNLVGHDDRWGFFHFLSRGDEDKEFPGVIS